MNNEIENKLPKTALSFYVKLFHKKRGNNIKDNRVLVEATKSWLALNKNDKQLFLKKYHEYQKNIKMAFADYLKKAEPYLKVKKKTKLKSENINEESITNQNIGNEDTELSIDENQKDQSNLQINGSNINITSFTSPQTDSHYNYIQSLENINNANSMVQNDKLPIVEPTPPKFITGEQLFRMINENEENNFTWAKLNTTQKRKYQNAVLSIKRKYLKEYKNYLEKLPSEKLFYHYKNTI